MKQLYKKISLVLLMFLMFTMVTPLVTMAAELPVNLGTASSFSLLAGSTITNTGTTTIAGNVGLHPGTVFSGQGTATVGGEIHLADAVALQAKNDFLAAYNNADGRVGNPVGAELGGTTITPGAYSAATELNITGTLTLDGQNDPNAVFIFQAGSTLITASSSNIVLINGANPNNIFWQVGTSATLGTNSQFSGNILAMESITAATGANIQGKLLTMTGAITLDNNTITHFDITPVESTTEVTTTTEPTTSEPTTSEPTTSEPTTSEPTTSEQAASEPATTEPTTSPEDEESIPQTGQNSNYGMALVLGMMAVLFAVAGIITRYKKNNYNA